MKKIGVFLSSKPFCGGTFQYNQSILDALNSLAKEEFKIFALYTEPEWKDYLNKYEFEKIEININNLLNVFARIIRKVISLLGYNIGELKRYYTFCDLYSHKIDSLKLDLIIFPSQEIFAAFINTPSLTAIHDLMHRYEKFPEIIDNGEYNNREYLYKNICAGTNGILVDSEIGKRHVIESYGKKYENKICVVPFTPPQYLFKKSNEKFAIELPKKFIFYPAQFWEHKNHLRLILAIKKLKDKGVNVNLILVGSKKNGYDEVLKIISEYDLNDNIEILGYVSDELMVNLYKKARAMIMPSLMGPTNIPPLEGMAMGCPVAVSNIYAMPDQVGNAGLLFNPKDVQSIANTIERLWLDDELCEELINKGHKQIMKFNQNVFNKNIEKNIRKLINE